jgi:pimeloyl-ACP methyl ester carboxylesterase
MTLAYPVIVVPGITASALRDEYTLPPESLWTALKKEYERVALHPDDMRYESIEPARVTADTVLEIAYKELIEELRHNLRESQDESVPVFAFPYDWRQPLEQTEAQLGAFIDEVIARTRLLRHYEKERGKAGAWIDNQSVNLVGHSMGGLVITGYLARAGKKAKVAKVATLATPFRGSFEAVIQRATGTANLGAGPPSSRERETARVTPALYHLVPTCVGLTVDGQASTATSLLVPDLWQRSIVDSLQEYVRLYAVDPKGAKQQAEELFAQLLKTAQDHDALVSQFKLSDAGLNNNDWLCVAGTNSETRVALNIDTKHGPVQFDFQSSDRDDQWDNDAAVRSERTGDGTVPFAGACPTFIPRERIVCVTPDDYGYWEVQDRLVSKAAGFHGILPNMDMLHRLLVRFFTGRPDKRGNTWGRRAPGIEPGKWDTPLELEEKS